MSTYNGEKYLRTQLESLLRQEKYPLNILIRDDGSTDNTLKIIDSYKQKYNNIRYYQGENKGPAKSFMEMLMNLNDIYDYYFFCDQDDFWMPNKIAKAIDTFKTNNPAMYYSATELVDSQLIHIGYQFRDSQFANSLYHSFLRGSLISGCTICFNTSLYKIIRLYNPHTLIMHDCWIHRLCLSIGGTIYSDSHSYIKYRQHTSNVLGLKKKNIFKRAKSLLKKDIRHREMATEIFNQYNKYITEDAYKFLFEFINYNQSIYNRYLFIRDVYSAVIDTKSKIIIFFKLLTKRL